MYKDGAPALIASPFHRIAHRHLVLFCTQIPFENFMLPATFGDVNVGGENLLSLLSIYLHSFPVLRTRWTGPIKKVQCAGAESLAVASCYVCVCLFVCRSRVYFATEIHMRKVISHISWSLMMRSFYYFSNCDDEILTIFMLRSFRWPCRRTWINEKNM